MTLLGASDTLSAVDSGSGLMVQADFYGKKSGRGFYDYYGPDPRVADLGL